MRENIQNYENEKARDIIEENWSTKKVKKAFSKGKSLLTKIRSGNNQVIYERGEIIKEATNFYRELYAQTAPRPNTRTESWNKEKSPPILKAEISKAIRNLKNNKSPGPDGIENETLKIFRKLIEQPLMEIFNQSLESAQIPKQWKIVEMILLHKKGDRANINNYRSCLLYTSPSPGDRTRSRMPSSA